MAALAAAAVNPPSPVRAARRAGSEATPRAGRRISTGKVLIPAAPNNNSTWDDGLLILSAHLNDPCGALNSCSLTLADSLGSSVTIILPPAKY
jgi:hypothetical protein